MARDYVLYGLRVRSDLELDAEPCEAAGCDVRLALDESETAALHPPAGKVLADYGDEQRGFWIVERETDYTLGIRGLLEARIAPEFDSVLIASAPGVSRDLLSTFVQGAILGTLLTLSGACVLHASCIELSGRAVAFLGPSGCGKSMLAALCCAAGGRLITDDLLLVRGSEAALQCQRGTTSLRLRQSSADLATLFTTPARVTADDRCSVRAKPSAAEVPLGVILLPERSAEERLGFTRLAGARAALAMASSPRIPGWHDERVIASSFRHAARLARSVPTYSLQVPQQGRTPEDLRDTVLAALGTATTLAPA